MPYIYVYALLIVAAPFAVQLVINWIVLPIKLRKSHPVSIQAAYTETSAEQLTLEQRQVIGGYVRQFIALGYQTIANVVSKNVQGAVGVVVVMVNQDRTETAQIIFATSKLSRNTSLVIRSAVQNGKPIITASSGSAGYLPPNPELDSINFGWARDPEALVEAHRRRLRSKPAAIVVPMHRTGIEFLNETHEISMKWFVNSGYYYRDEQAGVLRKTWKGAFLTVWKLRPWSKKLLQAYRQRKALRVWKKLGMESWESSLPAVAVQVDDSPQMASKPQPIDATAAVSYRPELSGGEMSIEHQNGTTLVRLGKLSRSQYLMIRWSSLLWLCVLAYYLLKITMYFFLIWRTPMLRRLVFPWLYYSTIWVSVALICYSVVAVLISLLRGMQRTGGTSVVSVTSDGLHFENAPARRKSGFIPRADIQNLLVVRREVRLKQSLYQLEVVMRNTIRHQPLLVAVNQAQLHEARTAIAAELGISSPVAQRSLVQIAQAEASVR